MTWTVREAAEWVGGEVVGDGDTPLTRPATLGDAAPGDLTFVDGEKNLKGWVASKAAAAVVPNTFPADPRPLIKVADPLAAFLQIVLRIRGDRPLPPRQIHPTAVIHPTARIGPNPSIGPQAVIGEGTTVGANANIHPGAVVGRFCTLGDDVTVHPNAVLYDDCKLGHRVIIHANAVIGADGFGYRMAAGQHQRIPQLGGVEIGDDVEVGAGSAIDCGTFGPTRIGAGTKIDNLVMIAHNCNIGRHNILVGQVGMAGSCTTGDYVLMGGQAGIADHIRIGDRAKVLAQCGVMSDVPPDGEVLGTPGLPRRDFLRMYVGMQKVAQIHADLKMLKKHLNLTEGGG